MIGEQELQQSIAIGPERTIEQDPAFAFRAIADSAIQALSPAINHPTTAVRGTDQLHHLLQGSQSGIWAMGRFGIRTGRLRLIFPTPDLGGLCIGAWAEDIKTHRCKDNPGSAGPGSCSDIRFYVVTVKFDALKGEAERLCFKRLPTAFKLTSEQVDKLREVAHRLLVESEEFQRLLKELN